MKKVVLFLAVFLLMTAGVFSHFLSGFDAKIYEAAKTLAVPGWLAFNKKITFFGDSFFIYPAGAILALLVALKGKAREGLFFYASFLLGTGFDYSLKILFDRIRPVFFDPSMVLLSPAYPSGHAFGAVVFYLLAVRLFSKNRFICGAAFFWALMIGASRIFLGVHWATDVFGGIFLGLAWVFSCNLPWGKSPLPPFSKGGNSGL